ncbi:alpha/beta hydrolase family protein [Catellatospora vulcania]|uniref:alpha/beta hydrolase family protein n=1 Tax=Catellatospora vulcania TaxID=1460450 RepID=UPI0012D3E3A6|nr:alpha/beta fold hydrolase [Catellatospora vulcania]
MFEYFPGNYVWNLAVIGALNSGALIDEVDRACRPLREAAARGADAGTEEFFASWTAVADRLEELAGQDQVRGWWRSAGQKLHRAALYVQVAERLQSRHWAPRQKAYERALDLFARATAIGRDNCTRVEIHYGDGSLPAYYVKAAGVDGPAPCIVLWNGLDSTKEMMYQSGFGHELAARGISTLMVDGPGTGEALRLRGVTAVADTERPAGACVDWLLATGEVDPARIGVVGWSLGGYYAPRAAAFEPRFSLCVAWGANHNWGQMQQRRLQREGEHPVPHYWDHVMWVWGSQTIDDFISTAQQVTLDGVVDKITVPFLVVHGENDRQIPLEYAHQSYDQAVNSPDRHLTVYTARDGGNEHIGLDNLPLVSTYIADWISDRFTRQAA